VECKTRVACNWIETSPIVTLSCTNPTWTGMERMRVSAVVNVLHSRVGDCWKDSRTKQTEYIYIYIYIYIYNPLQF